MRRLRWLSSAQSDLVQTLEYVTRQSGSLESGRRFIVLLRERCRDFAALPGTLGVARPELRPDIRSFVFKGYVVFFRYRPNVFEVVNIIEGHRDIEALFAAQASDEANRDDQ